MSDFIKRISLSALLLVVWLLAACASPQPGVIAPAPSEPTAQLSSDSGPREMLPMNPIIPLPVAVSETGDVFTLTAGTMITVDPANDELAAVGDILAQWLGAAARGFRYGQRRRRLLNPRRRAPSCSRHRAPIQRWATRATSSS